MRTKLAFTLVAFFAFASTALAQEGTTTLDFTRKSVKVRDLVQVLIEESGYIVDEASLRSIDAACVWQEKIVMGDLKGALDLVLPRCGNEATVVRPWVTIRKRSDTPSLRRAFLPQQEPEAGEEDEEKSNSSQPAQPSSRISNDGSITLIDGYIVDGETIRQLRALHGDRYIAELISTENRRRQGLYGYGGYYNPPFGGYGYGGAGYGYGAYEAESWRRFFITGSEGAMKTKGDTKEVALFARGCYIGDADQLDSWYNQKSAQYAGQAVKVTAVKDGRAFNRTIRFPSEAEARAVGMQHITFTIRNSYFESGYVFNESRADAECRASLR